jgi:DNA-binding NtrC family response regulator
LVDDDPAIQHSFGHYLGRVGFRVTAAATLGEARHALAQHRPDIILLDLRLPDGDGLDFILEAREASPNVSIVVVTAAGEVAVAVDAMRRGADNYLVKPVRMADLEVYLDKCAELGTLRRRQRNEQRLSRPHELRLGTSRAMADVAELVDVAVEQDVPVLVLGETGTGKSLLARWIHERGTRRQGTFVDVNCSALRGELLASELFGHVRGAFTSAFDARQGLLEVADGGTLFLDEVGDMDAAIQGQFLKVLEERRFRRVGDTRERTSDFRLVCATNRDVDRDVVDGRLRKDLYFRINVLSICLPPLRQRKDDLPDLAQDLLVGMGRPGHPVTDSAWDRLRGYDWPGNIRELRNVLERAVLLARGGPVDAIHLPGLEAPRDLLLPGFTPRASTADDAERAMQRHATADEAARSLGISRATLFRRLKRSRGAGSGG